MHLLIHFFLSLLQNTDYPKPFTVLYFLSKRVALSIHLTNALHIFSVTYDFLGTKRKGKQAISERRKKDVFLSVRKKSNTGDFYCKMVHVIYASVYAKKLTINTYNYLLIAINGQTFFCIFFDFLTQRKQMLNTHDSLRFIIYKKQML